MMRLPVGSNPWLEKGVIAMLSDKRRLFKTTQGDGPWLMEEIGEIEGSRIGTSALDSKEVLSIRINKIIHLFPPVNILEILFMLVATNPFPVNRYRESCHPIVYDL